MPHSGGSSAGRKCCRPQCGKTGTRSVPSSLFRGATAKVCKACYTWMRRHFQVEPNGKHVRCAEVGILPRCSNMLRDFEDAGVLPANAMIRTYPKLVLASSRRKLPLAPATPPASPSPAPTRRSSRRSAAKRALGRVRASYSYAYASSDDDDSDLELERVASTPYKPRPTHAATTPPVRAGDDGLHDVHRRHRDGHGAAAARASAHHAALHGALPPPRTRTGARAEWPEIGFEELGDASGTGLPVPSDPPDSDGDVDMGDTGSSGAQRHLVPPADDGLISSAASPMLHAGDTPTEVAGWEFISESGATFDDEFDLDGSNAWPSFFGAGMAADSDGADGPQRDDADQDMAMSVASGGATGQDIGWAFLASAQPCGSPTATAMTLFPASSRPPTAAPTVSAPARATRPAATAGYNRQSQRAGVAFGRGCAGVSSPLSSTASASLKFNPRRPGRLAVPRPDAPQSPSTSLYAQSVCRAASARRCPTSTSAVGRPAPPLGLRPSERSSSTTSSSGGLGGRMVHVSSTDSLLGCMQRARAAGIPASPGLGKLAVSRSASGSSLTSLLGIAPSPPPLPLSETPSVRSRAFSRRAALSMSIGVARAVPSVVQ